MVRCEVGKRVHMQTWFCLTEETDHKQMPAVVLPSALSSNSSYECCHRTSTTLTYVSFHFASFQLDVLLLSVLLLFKFVLSKEFPPLLVYHYSSSPRFPFLPLLLHCVQHPFCYLVLSPKLVFRGPGQ